MFYLISVISFTRSLHFKNVQNLLSFKNLLSSHSYYISSYLHALKVHDKKMKKLFSIDATDGIIHVHDILDNSFQFGYFLVEVRVDDHTTGD